MGTYRYIGSELTGTLTAALPTKPDLILPMEGGSGAAPDGEFFAHLTVFRMARLWFGPRNWRVSATWHAPDHDSYDDHSVTLSGQMTHPCAMEEDLVTVKEFRFGDSSEQLLNDETVAHQMAFEMCLDGHGAGGDGCRYTYDPDTKLWTPRLMIDFHPGNAESIVLRVTNQEVATDAFFTVLGSVKIPTPTDPTDATAPWTLTEEMVTLKVLPQEGVDPDAGIIDSFTFTLEPDSDGSGWWPWRNSHDDPLVDVFTGNVRPGRSPLEKNL